MAQLSGVISKIGDGRIVKVWLCDANYIDTKCLMFGPIFRYPNSEAANNDGYHRHTFMSGLGWSHYLDGGSTVCPNCSDRFQKES